jgi:hypothetical protein
MVGMIKSKTNEIIDIDKKINELTDNIIEWMVENEILHR